jgi:hypothetical protein
MIVMRDGSFGGNRLLPMTILFRPFGFFSCAVVVVTPFLVLDLIFSAGSHFVLAGTGADELAGAAVTAARVSPSMYACAEADPPANDPLIVPPSMMTPSPPPGVMFAPVIDVGAIFAPAPLMVRSNAYVAA